MSNYSSDIGDVDIIFAGGGTAACVAAGRLAKANPDLKILLIEGGQTNFENPTVRNPAVYLSHLAPDSKTALFYKSKASTHLNGREAIVPMGGILGGGSSINFMMYTRAQGADFDSWNTEGWSAKEMLPISNKLETFLQDEPGIDQGKHGHNGPITVSDGGFRGKSEMQFMETIKRMGLNEVVDLQDFDQVGGFSRWQRYVDKEGKRQDAAHCYIHPLLQDGQHPNLHVLVEAKVVKVIFDESTPPRAIGVQYKPNEEHVPSLALSKTVEHVIKAKKLVVVSAGALGTPQILERSGLGNLEILKKLDIPVIADLPGVGENYQDHHLLLYPYKSNLEPEETLDAILSGRKDFAKALEAKDPQLGWNGIDICAKLRMSDKDVAHLGHEFQEDWKRDFVPYPTRPVMLCGIVNAFLADPSLVEPGQYVTAGVYTAYPYSRGSIHITSKDDVTTGYDFDTGFLNHPSDIKKQLWAYKMHREILRRLPYYRGELELGHPKFPAGSKAALVDLTKEDESHDSLQVNGHGHSHSLRHGSDIADVEYSAEDDAAIEDWIRGNLNTTWHSLGTCAMKPRDKGGVVDQDLNVYGTTALKVVDLSMVPENVGANTNNTALAVGEKAALIIGRDLGIEV